MRGEKVTDSKIIDSSVWIAYITKKAHSEITESEAIVSLSVLSIFEIKRKLIRDKISDKDIEENIKFIKERSILMPITAEIAEKAAEISSYKNIPAIDSLIYATAILNNLTLITLDNDFRDLANVQVLEI